MWESVYICHVQDYFVCATYMYALLCTICMYNISNFKIEKLLNSTVIFTNTAAKDLLQEVLEFANTLN